MAGWRLKDAKDLLRIAAVAKHSGVPFRAERVTPYLRDGHLELLTRVERGPHAMSLARANAMQAKRLRQSLTKVIAELARAAAR